MNRRRSGLLALACTVVGLGVATPLAAQSAGDGFLFRPPSGAVTLRAGAQAPAGRSDLFSFTNDQLTLDRRKLSGITYGVDVAIASGDRWEWVLSADLLSRAADSEYRRFEEQLPNGTRVPIRQRTEFRRVPLTLGVRYALRPEGERIGQYAWLPTRIVPFVMAGAGTSWYKFRQRGDFVDFDNGNAIFTDDYDSDGWGLIGYAGAGVDVALSTTTALTTQVRATVGNSPLDRDFRGFAPIDLSGLSLTVGLRLRLH